MIAVGESAPDFDLPGTGGRRYTLAEHRGAPVVLAFYPADGSPVCSIQLPDYSLDIEAFRELGATLLAISPQDVDSHEDFARRLGATWAGGSDETPPDKLDAAIIFAPAGSLVPAALRAVGKGGCVVCGGIHMSDIPSFPYEWLWGERRIVSVANLTRRDGTEFLALAPKVPVKTTVETFALEEANTALARLRDGRINGAAVLVMNGP